MSSKVNRSFERPFSFSIPVTFDGEARKNASISYKNLFLKKWFETILVSFCKMQSGWGMYLIKLKDVEISIYQ